MIIVAFIVVVALVTWLLMRPVRRESEPRHFTDWVATEFDRIWP